jgi:hypothetical protein
MNPPRPHPLIVRASALARTRNWPTIWSVGRQACFSLGGASRLTVNAAPDGPFAASVSFHLDPAQVGSVEALEAELGRGLADAALAVAPQRIGP